MQRERTASEILLYHDVLMSHTIGSFETEQTLDIGEHIEFTIQSAPSVAVPEVRSTIEMSKLKPSKALQDCDRRENCSKRSIKT